MNIAAFSNYQADTVILGAWVLCNAAFLVHIVRIDRRYIARIERDAERYDDLCGCIEGVNVDQGASGTGIHAYCLQIVEPLSVMTKGDLMKQDIDEAIDALYSPALPAQLIHLYPNT